MDDCKENEISKIFREREKVSGLVVIDLVEWISWNLIDFVYLCVCKCLYKYVYKYISNFVCLWVKGSL